MVHGLGTHFVVLQIAASSASCSTWPSSTAPLYYMPEVYRLFNIQTVLGISADRVYVSLGTAGTYPGYGPVYRNVPWFTETYLVYSPPYPDCPCSVHYLCRNI